VAGRYGFARGFEVYDDRSRTLRENLDKAMERISSLDSEERYFVFIHTYDVHCPYDPPASHAELFRSSPPEDWLETRGRCGNPHYNRMSLTDGQVRFLSDQYDAGVHFMDQQLGEFVSFLDARGELDDTTLVLLSDHGEEFREHGQIGHERTLYIESLMVPLILAGGNLDPRTVDTPVGLADTMPTVLTLLGLVPPSVPGRSLEPLMTGTPLSAEEVAAFSELDRGVVLRSILRGADHLIVGPEGQHQLFDLAIDPTEQRDFFEALPQRAGTLARELSAYFAGLTTTEPMPADELTDEQLERLRSLGYLN
jgi:arylsulfatase A-like enzyme